MEDAAAAPTAPEGSAWRIEPSGALRGDVVVAGSKNAVTKHMVAALLGDSPSTITNAPDVGDVGITADILRSVGVGVEVEGDRITVLPSPEPIPRVPLEFSGLNRIPILLLGPLLHRAHEAFVPLVGGDKIGRRPIDFHVSALQQMGAELELHNNGITARMRGRLKGTRITLPYPSVGATETVILSAVLAEGRTVIHNAALEPEVTELALFLQRMGALIAFRPDRRIVIEGVESLSGAQARLAGDRLEAFSYLVAGLMTGGQVRVGGCHQDRLVTAINTLQRMGARLEITDEWITASATRLRPAAVQTDTHPGFMTDWQPPLIVLMTQADGMSVLHETVYEDRLGYVDAIKAMGGEVELFDTCLGGPACRFHDSSAKHSAVVRGVSKLQGADVTIPDVRAGFSSVIAAAAAEGASILHGIHHLERGYNRPFETLRSLGLNLTRV
ncbi:MAG TPA: UDP-N-acetylglucosamine 1-carboxyvinyltransferase [Acidimicrobiales bacterium]|nr:UDP-N-acetylglucosamine 1-carboxyvinyltransferase [Acidimicrobiales bacterium]